MDVVFKWYSFLSEAFVCLVHIDTCNIIHDNVFTLVLLPVVDGNVSRNIAMHQQNAGEKESVN